MNKSRKGPCLGLIGGLGVGATTHYYRELIKAHEAVGQTPNLLIAHADMRSVFEHIQTNRPDRLAEYLDGFIRKLKAGGADFAAIAAVTPHLCLQQLSSISSLPLVSVMDAISEEIAARSVRRVSIFGTRFTIETNLFGQLKDVAAITPFVGEVNYIDETYLRIASHGSGSDADFKGLTDLGQTLCKREHVDAIILAGTDFALLFDERNTDFPHIDCARSHIDRILRTMLMKTTDRRPDLGVAQSSMRLPLKIRKN